MSDRLYRRLAIGLGVFFAVLAMLGVAASFTGPDGGAHIAVGAVLLCAGLWAVAMMGLAGLR